MRTRTSLALIVGGSTLAVIGAAVSFIYLLQPWRTCPDDDAPAGCPMLPDDAVILTMAMIVAVLATAMAVAGAAIRKRHSG
ncbi:hypothetical protein [Promicromonospora sp. NPDC023805]|uniref:hypothetical protein n=1 Tax=Promicromonospora sp. NPDC023805 TaxID=3154696 RepID=UPI00340EC7C4